MQKFLDAMEVILEEKVSMDQNFRDFDAWDSLAFLSTIAMAQSDYGKQITRSELEAQKTVGDIYALLTGN